METVELFLLEGSYQALDDGVVIELFGKTRDGEPLVARYYGFRPYFMLVDPPAESLESLRADGRVLGLEETRLTVGSDERRVVRVTIRFPWLVPEFREKYRRKEGEPGPEDVPSVLASDIPFVHRFLYDKGVGLTLAFEAETEPPEVAARYTIPRVLRIVTSDGHDVRPTDPFRPELRVLSFDIENAITARTIFTICGVIDRGENALTAFRIAAGDEKGMLEEFARVIEREDPDVITGYNIGGYDFPLLIERMRAAGLAELPLGRERSSPRDMGERLWRVTGRIVADAWWFARRELRPKQESLDFVARQLLGVRKLDVDRRRIEEEWARDRDRVLAYCEKDAELALRILEKLRALDRAADLATVAHLPLEEGLNGRTSLFVDSLLIPRADRSRVGVPPTRRLRRDAPIEGGYVHTIRPGIHRWVVLLDFKSMYPSIIISKNICFSTLSPDGATVAPTGVRFLTPDVRRGLIPAILEELLASRDRFRAELARADTPEAYRYYDGLQNAVKILMNSFYGVLASSFYRFTNKEIGAAITAYARESITSIIRSLLEDGYEVVYADTDSVFVRSPTPGLEGARAFGESLAKRFSQAGVIFEFQAVYDSLFSHGAKKRYVGRSSWPRDELVIRGYETRRTDAFDYQSAALLEVFDLVLREDTDGAIRRARELVLACRTGKVPDEQLVISRSVRAEEQYNAATRDALPFLRIFRQLKEEGYDVFPGMRVAWIVTDARKTPQEVEPWIEGRALTKRPDYGYYADRVAQTLARVTEVFDWDAAALLRGSHQQRFEAAPPTAPPAPAVTLDTPIADLSKPVARRRTTRPLSDFE